MNSSMINAMVSMGGLQQKLDLLADNIANANTAGYKRKDATFEDLLTNMKRQQDAFEQPGRLTPMGFNVGWGSRMVLVQPDLSQGPIQRSDNLNDIAIQGSAMFEVAVDDLGNRAFTRNGAFQMTLNENNDAVLTNADGYPVIAETAAGDSQVVIPDGYSMRIDAYGGIQAVSKDGFDVRNLGRLKLVQPIKPSVLSPVADNLFVVAQGLNQGEVVRRVVPGEGNDVRLMQGYLEQSNVELGKEMSELMIVQRAYQMSARALSSSDTMMQLANNLRS
ncbi:flagellar basal body rod protein FlgG [Paenibacillus darwinianus]|uniref:Flagellar basal body rod protein FlgG n=1 Tax=Paenibacillus darwinianus TaxID=1380763 RepID=A0A9W5RZU8_9BACL|nr:flagellar hook-basal body protein [Paenibacillus darwinianus]EXX85636.1 flagellar basal body rod protein FlgG [Paenibacillus darwinianus]EXX85649.1 flagellar basal body rod protein FlgG [Paenibacillus darwinianus]EXX88851.1 flagellar basal body rod protein FlgG [Paenibacillus darwinianus]